MTQVPLPDAASDGSPELLPGLAGREGLDEMEAIMLHLAVGARLDGLGRMVSQHLGTGGRRMRARLAFAAAEVLGVERSRAVAWAAACELVHNATLVHDDLQDGDRLRRGAPSLWARYGAAQAINAGDLLLTLPYLAIADVDVDDATRWRLCRALAQGAERTVRGQSLEMELVASRRLDWSCWAAAAEGKSGALLALPVEGAAILGGLRPQSAAPLAAAFATLGVVYQLHDDVLDLWGEKGRERRGNDLREGKPSAVVAAHLLLYPEETADVVALLLRPREQTEDADVDAMIGRFEAGGALRILRDRLVGLESQVLDTPTLRAVPELRAIAEQLVAQLRNAAPSVLGVK